MPTTDPTPTPSTLKPKETTPAKPRYLVVALGDHDVTANDALATSAKDGYSTLESVYVITAPSGMGTAFAVLSA